MTLHAAQHQFGFAPCWDRTSALMWNEGLVEIRITEAEHLTATLDRPCMPRVAFMHNCFVFFLTRHVHAVLMHAAASLTQQKQTETQRGGHGHTGSAATQAAPTCYRDMNTDHRTVLDCSNSFLHPSCPYWSGPSPPRCAPVVLFTNKM